MSVTHCSSWQVIHVYLRHCDHFSLQTFSVPRSHLHKEDGDVKGNRGETCSSNTPIPASLGGATCPFQTAARKGRSPGNFSTALPAASGIICALQKGSRASDFQEDSITVINMFLWGHTTSKAKDLCMWLDVGRWGQDPNINTEATQRSAWSKDPRVGHVLVLEKGSEGKKHHFVGPGTLPVNRT